MPDTAKRRRGRPPLPPGHKQAEQNVPFHILVPPEWLERFDVLVDEMRRRDRRDRKMSESVKKDRITRRSVLIQSMTSVMDDEGVK